MQQSRLVNRFNHIPTSARWLRRPVLASAFALSSLAACGSEDDKPAKPSAGTVGSTCEIGNPACAEGLECTAGEGSGVCTYPAGVACSPDNQDLVNGGCAADAVCKAPDPEPDMAAGEPVCLVTEGGGCDPEQAHCDSNLTCAELASGEHKCFAPVIFHGQVSSTATGAAISDAQVIAIDSEGVAASDVAVTDAEGNYDLEVPVLRQDDGTPIATTFTLRGAAQDFQPFPSGIRVALPISTSDATSDTGMYVVESALTQITLIPLETAGLQAIHGRLVGLDGMQSELGGVLIVAAGGDAAASAITDKSGTFTVFNVPSGSYEVRGYAAELQLEAESVVVADADVEGVELHELGDTTTTVTGNLQIVNAPGGALTSVILVVDDTFDPTAIRGEAPRGLRAPKSGAPNVNGDFTIEGVPAGRYVVLAAYENDDLVRDPSDIGGTELVRVEVGAGQATAAVGTSFKITEALQVIGPGTSEPEAVSSAPTLTWADDSGEEWYEVRVFNAFGDEVWNNLMVPAVTGQKQVTLAYAGPLDPGMYYQFRVSSWSQSGNSAAQALATTEDLRGVFFVKGQP